MSLDTLLGLSDRIQEFNTESNGLRICHGCDRQAMAVKKCAKCSLFWYCNEACQKVGWVEKGHKADCKALRDSDLKGLLSLSWDDFQGLIRFPLARVS
jgi:sulfatase maturation enzyme AslB (radical SAM superfamily)